MDTGNLVLIGIAVAQGAGALVLLFFKNAMSDIRDDVREFHNDLKECRESITSLAGRQASADKEAVSIFASKEDHQALRERVHDLSENVTMLRTLATMKRGSGD